MAYEAKLGFDRDDIEFPKGKPSASHVITRERRIDADEAPQLEQGELFTPGTSLEEAIEAELKRDRFKPTHPGLPSDFQMRVDPEDAKDMPIFSSTPSKGAPMMDSSATANTPSLRKAKNGLKNRQSAEKFDQLKGNPPTLLRDWIKMADNTSPAVFRKLQEQLGWTPSFQQISEVKDQLSAMGPRSKQRQALLDQDVREFFKR
jgi:hypothetical protein